MFIVSCSDNPTSKSGDNKILNLTVTVNSTDYSFTNLSSETAIEIPSSETIPSSITLKSITISTGATSSVAKGGTVVITANKGSVVITAENGDGATFTFLLNKMTLGTSAEVTLFKMTAITTDPANQMDYSLTFTTESISKVLSGLDTGRNLKQIERTVNGVTKRYFNMEIKELTLSPGASSSIAVGDVLDFETPMSTAPPFSSTFTVTSEDGSTTKTYTISVNFAKISSELQALEVNFNSTDYNIIPIDTNSDNDFDALTPLKIKSSIPSSVTVKSIIVSTGATASVSNDDVLPLTSGRATITVSPQDTTLSSEDYTLKIIEEDKYTVTFDMNGGTIDPVIPPQMIYKDGNATKPTEKPVKIGEIFSGWGMTSTGSVTFFNFITTKIIADITLYARYIDAFTFTTDNSGISGIAMGANTLSGDFIVPKSYNGVDVVKIAGLSGSSNIKSLRFENRTVDFSIADEAFSRCLGLTEIVLPATLKRTGDSFLADCSALESITIPASVTAFGDESFVRNRLMTSATFEATSLVLGENTFEGCVALTSLTLPNDIGATLQARMFRGCSALTTVTIPSGVQTIGIEALSGCSSLTSVAVPNTVTRIEGFSFKGCSAMRSITLPSALRHIESGTFAACSNLTITMLGAMPPTINGPLAGTFADGLVAKIIVPSGAKATYDVATNWSQYASIIE